MNRIKVGFASDHAGFEYKNLLMGYINTDKFEVVDFGTFNAESCDYSDFAHKLGVAVENGGCAFGFAFCGSGNGINMTLNKHNNVRGALCWTAEIAKLARQHNDANVCTIPARFISKDTAVEILNAFIETGFEGGRHLLRVKKINIDK